MITFPSEVSFYKMQGSGNDFVFIDNNSLQLSVSQMPVWARRICRRAFGVGADGLIFLEHALKQENIDYRWHFYNADGSRAEMCGNGSRCAAWLAHRLGLAPAEHVLGTDAGPVRAAVDEHNREVQVQLTALHSFQPDIELFLDSGQAVTVHMVNTGVPHVVFFSDRADEVNIRELGPALRYHQRFAPAGANVNIVQTQDADNLYVRTYERGVEDETHACGTGAAAAAFVAHTLGKCKNPVQIRTSGGEELGIFISGDDVYLQGKAVLVYTGQLDLSAVGLTPQNSYETRS
ncbi:MAG: diaminopimelate epimerase [Desulfovermiculus sp.]